MKKKIMSQIFRRTGKEKEGKRRRNNTRGIYMTTEWNGGGGTEGRETRGKIRKNWRVKLIKMITMRRRKRRKNIITKEISMCFQIS